MKVGVLGAGYVGLVAAACFAESGNDVICVDIDEHKIARLNQGEVPIYEPGLDHLLKNNIEDGRLSFSTDVALCVRESSVIFVAVGTPQDADGSADLRFVLQVAAEIGKNMNGHKIVVTKSTVPVGTADLVTAEIKKHTALSFDVVSNPEFLKEGAAIDDFMKPDRVVIGASNPAAAKVMEELYGPFMRTGKPILIMDVRSAELTKYASNALLATRVTFMNEIANLCERVGADVAHVRRGVGTDARIGPSFLSPAWDTAVPVSPKDVRALVRTAADAGYELEIVKAVDRVNDRQKQRLVEKICRHFGGADKIKGKRFALWGLAFKPNTDDMREAPSLTIIAELAKLGATMAAYDPEAMEVARAIISAEGYPVDFTKTGYLALEGADALLVITEWNEFRRPDFARIRTTLRSPVIFDGRNLFETDLMLREGFAYYSIGRSPVGVTQHGAA